ncbi:MAG TPA: DUF559 domain-containing protein [Rhizomicrobium sp.]|jgi:very-short-patch-repair endonuclease|nr:DUF559 domain-containing protein [Rhizomicrobium sp.]
MSERKSRSTNRSRAREMRHEPVAMEELFWSAVRNRKLGGYKFKRQYLIDPYIADFVCVERKLIVELDGKLHDDRQGYDSARDAFLRIQGYEVLRFKNEYLGGNFDVVLATVLHALSTPSPRPSPPLRGGEGDSTDKP